MTEFWREEWAQALAHDQLSNHGVHFTAAFFLSGAGLVLGLPAAVAWPLAAGVAIGKELIECYWKARKSERVWLIDSWLDVAGLLAGGWLPWLLKWWL